MGLLERLERRLCGSFANDRDQAPQLARDIAFALAGAANQAFFSVDVLLHATGIAKFGTGNLGGYAARHPAQAANSLP